MVLALDVDSDVVRAATLTSGGAPRMIALGAQEDAMPAVVRRTMHGWMAGAEAERSRFGNSETTVGGITRLMGRAGGLSHRALERLPFPVRIQGNDLFCNLLYAEVRPDELYTELLRATLASVESRSGQPVDEVVLTVPAGADEWARIRARQAAERAGVKVRKVINQPTAALLGANLPTGSQRVLVLHVGSDSVDATVAEVDGNDDQRQVRVLSTKGYPQSGGHEWAWRVTGEVAERIRRRSGIDLESVDSSAAAMQGLHRTVEEALAELASAESTDILLEHGGGFGLDVRVRLYRSEVEQWLRQQMSNIEGTCKRAWDLADIPRRWDGLILLTGAMAFWPQLQRTAAALTDGRLLVASPEATVLGAARAISGRTSVWDVTPYPLGITCYYGESERFSAIIHANSPIPTPPIGQANARTESYTTRFPDQTSVRLDVLQYRGELNVGSGNSGVPPEVCEKLGSWLFSDLRPRPGAHADFTVTFAVDGDGILDLEAVETATGRRLAAQVERKIGE